LIMDSFHDNPALFRLDDHWHTRPLAPLTCATWVRILMRKRHKGSIQSSSVEEVRHM
jgi:hypothetical protein